MPDPIHEFSDAPTLQEDFGLAPVERSQIRRAQPPSGPAGATSSLSDAADAELRNRIRDLLEEARARGDAGNIDEAIAVLSRAFILDEDNAEARDLESELRSRAESGVADIESWLVEGIQAFEASRHEDARRWFNNVLERIPDHRQALHYLEKIEAASAPHDGSFGGGQGAEPGKPAVRPVARGPSLP